MDSLALYETVVILIMQAFGLLSFLACLCTWGECRTEASSVVARIQYWMQFPLGLLSLTYALAWITAESDSALGLGNSVTCQVQGVLYQFSLVGSMGLDVFLSLYYLLLIQQQWSEDRLSRLPSYVHALVWPVALIPAVVGLWGGYSMMLAVCWMPPDGNVLWIRHWTNGLALLHYSFSCYVMVRVYKFAVDHAASRSSLVVARKGMLYAGSITLIQTPHLLYKMAQLAGFSNEKISVATCVTIPLAGLLNMLVFILYRTEMQTRYGRVVRRLVFGCGCWCRSERLSDSKYPQVWVLGQRDLFASSLVEDEEQKVKSLDSIPEEDLCEEWP